MGSHSGPRRGLLARWKARRACRRRYKALIRRHRAAGGQVAPSHKAFFKDKARQEAQR
jgi:hypothetical protein